jgi:hypothetical protein
VLFVRQPGKRLKKITRTKVRDNPFFIGNSFLVKLEKIYALYIPKGENNILQVCNSKSENANLSALQIGAGS